MSNANLQKTRQDCPKFVAATMQIGLRGSGDVISKPCHSLAIVTKSGSSTNLLLNGWVAVEHCWADTIGIDIEIQSQPGHSGRGSGMLDCMDLRMSLEQLYALPKAVLLMLINARNMR